jgi:hypothetical protein
MRKYTDAELLKTHIFANSGGHSIDFARNILGLANQAAFEKPDVFSSDVLRLLETYGPGLISSMEIWSCFVDRKRSSHCGLPEGDLHGHHSMVMVGYRRCNSRNFFLLQNWWQNKVFVEVDAQYLRACGAIVTFCNLPQTLIPDNFDTNLHRHVEAAHDSCEISPLEV